MTMREEPNIESLINSEDVLTSLVGDLAWNTKTDMSPCTSIKGVVYYAAKYASKTEIKTEPQVLGLFANVHS